MQNRIAKLNVKSWASLVLLLALSACTNQTGPIKKSSSTGVNQSISTSTGTAQSTITFTIQSVSISKDSAAIPANTASVDERVYPYVATLTLQSTLSSLPKIGDVCTLSSDPASATCFCRFQWDDSSLPAGSDRTRIAETPIRGTASNQFSPQCAMTPAYASEITKNTVISISIFSRDGQTTVPVQSNVYAKTKSDELYGQEIAYSSFRNVQRYTCTRKFKKGMSIRSAQAAFSTSSQTEIKTYAANRFCYVVADGTSTGRASSQDKANSFTFSPPPGGSSTGELHCEGGDPALDYSGQGYLFNLYLTANEVSSTSYIENDNYQCSVDKSNNQFYPLDSQFRLAAQSTKDLTKPVVAQSCLGDQNGSCVLTVSTYNSPGCDNSANGSESTKGGIVRRCLGWAAPREIDGSCRTISVKNGSQTAQPVKTYPLRRFVAMYPYVYDVNGRPVPMVDASLNSGNQLAPSVLYDEVYVLDRPVGNSGFSMRGALPCPQSYYDSSRKEYYPSFLTSTALSSGQSFLGRNIDGVQLPNIDANASSGVAGSCSALMPVAEYDSNGRGRNLGLATLGANVSPRLKEAFTAPIQPFSPVYHEDTSFQACAPESTQYSDPYLVMSDNGAQWCAMVTPNFSEDLNKGTSDGSVLPVVTARAANLNAYKIPLTSDATQIKDVLNLNMNSMHRERRAPAATNYSCSVTQDLNGSRSKLGLAPSGGCCPKYEQLKAGKKCAVPTY